MFRRTMRSLAACSAVLALLTAGCATGDSDETSDGSPAEERAEPREALGVPDGIFNGAGDAAKTPKAEACLRLYRDMADVCEAMARMAGASFAYDICMQDAHDDLVDCINSP
jgi:hypothetical protein